VFFYLYAVLLFQTAFDTNIFSDKMIGDEIAEQAG